MLVEKAGLHINGDKEVIGWVAVGSEVDLKEGDVIVSHGKTAQKFGVAEQYTAMKPKKTKKEGKGRTIAPTSGSYTVLKSGLTLKEDERSAVAKILLENNTFENFWASAPKSYKHVGRKGESKEFSTSGFVTYAIRRGMIEVA